MPSKKAQPSTESQLACKHPVGNLLWHENDYVRQARCKACYLKKVIYFEKLPPKQVFMLGQQKDISRSHLEILAVGQVLEERNGTNPFRWHFESKEETVRWSKNRNFSNSATIRQ